MPSHPATHPTTLEPVDSSAPEPEPITAPEPVPLVEIHPDSMVAAPASDAPFNRAQLEQIAAVQPIVAAAATAHGVDPALINGLIWVESGFDPRAKGGKAQGLMQLMPKTSTAMAKLLGRKRAPFDPDFNIHAGTLLLSRLLARFDGDVTLALAGYNRGPGTVANWIEAGEPIPARTQTFVDRVLEARGWFERPLPVVGSEAPP